MLIHQPPTYNPWYMILYFVLFVAFFVIVVILIVIVHFFILRGFTFLLKKKPNLFIWFCTVLLSSILSYFVHTVAKRISFLFLNEELRTSFFTKSNSSISCACTNDSDYCSPTLWIPISICKTEERAQKSLYSHFM